MTTIECYYDPTATYAGIIDTINPDTGLTRVNGNTYAEVKHANPHALRIDFDDACKAIDRRNRAQYCKGISEIDSTTFSEFLEMLPPRGWIIEQESESFKMCEMLTGNLTSIYIRIGRTDENVKNARYFHMTENVHMKHARIVELAHQWIRTNAAKTPLRVLS